MALANDELMTAPQNEPAVVPLIVDPRLSAAAERMLSAWGEFAPAHRQRLVARIAAAASTGAPTDPDKQAYAAMESLLVPWAQALAGEGDAMSIEALRAAFLAIDGARRWPEQYVETSVSPAFRDELCRAVPRPLPAAAPLDMPEQPL
ncbi:MAG TPA: hypothetical protein VJ890_23735 [Vineibacter sp.]|nr:hypothetical protein [Vineibacter sp.]